MDEEKEVKNIEEIEDDARADRGKWANKAEFLLSCIGYCVGLGNVWRFPYLAYENGGGSFLIPYVIMLTFCGIPLFLIELSLGQFSGFGAMTAWRASPIFKGIGMGMMLVSFFVVIYYNVIIAWALYYLFASFQSVLPWTHPCGQEWNSMTCDEYNATVLMATTPAPIENVSKAVEVKRISPSEEYWQNRVLRINNSAGMEDPGSVLWDLCLCLLLAWIIVFACLIKGVKSSGKVVYFTATFPYIILIILLIRGCTLEGALDGIIFYVKPKWHLLQTAKVWKDAAIQIFYSLGISFGGLLTFASYNKFNNNLYRDTFIVAIGNCITSIFAGFVIFSVIGHMALRLGTDTEKVIDQGPGLAFIAYPEAVSLLPIPQLWSILFFFMLLTLGLDSQFAMVETVITGLLDEFPRVLRPKKYFLTAAICIVSFLLGILLVTEGGLYWFEFYNSYSAYYGLLVLSLILCVVVSWGYGFWFTYPWRFSDDIKLMIGHPPGWFFIGNWMLVAPGLLLFVIIFSAMSHGPITLGDYTYPKWADDLGLCLSATCVAIVPIYMIYRIILALVKKESISELFKPSKKWGPQDRSIPYDQLTGANTTTPLGVYAIGSDPPTFEQAVNDDITDPFPEKKL
ncbi:sodium-dependent proline transporter-like [Clavelina lepadiformis]|uniref:sodium-dependent proline transporter-like n=1 Tax=Clavelina lepadiformis TaxID=159417 RepID=UPI00404320DF